MSFERRIGRPKGGRQAKPTKAAIANYYRLLTDAADKGDTTAAGWLVSIAEQRQAAKQAPDGAADEETTT